ncbi:MAG TPA: phenylalanine--tRNA ligase subunit beta [Clostridia bacterium]
MKLPLKWLKDYTDIDVSPREYAHALTMSGSKVEGLEVLGSEIDRVVVGKILTVEKHPDADRLQVCQVDVGSGTIQIVTGATNIKVNDLVPVALDGSSLPGGIRIKKGKLRGVESAGMMCSIAELGLTKDDYPNAAEDGIFILEGDPDPGTDIKEYLGMNDTVVEFEITSNRPDCFSIIGLARESAATFGTSFRIPEVAVKELGEPIDGKVSVEIKAPDLCARYAARIVENVKIGPSPRWMQQRLRASGIRPINNIVDITNYVMLEYGQPMHAFDLRNLKGRRIIVRRAENGEIMRTLDGQDRKLDESMLVIADAERPVAVAGVMGGENSEITDDTTAILFESANFDGISVRLTAKKLGMRTESSSRFEKGLDPENVINALNRAAQLVEEFGAGTVCRGIIDCYPKKYQRRTIPFNPKFINGLLGTDISAEKMLEIFRRLEIEYDEATGTVIPPTFRPDLENEADLAEEVARFYDYNNIKPTLLEGRAATIGGKTRKQKIKDIISQTMLSCGLSETYTYSFTSPKVFDMLNLPADSPLRKAIVISNPLGEDYSVMRTTTIPDMLRVLATNYNRRVEEARLFEISCVYIPKSLPVTELPDEKPALTIGMYGEDIDFYDLSGIIEELMESLGIKEYELEPVRDDPTFHPGRTARLIVKGENVGILGEIHPAAAENFEAAERNYIAFIEIEPLVRYASTEREYKPLPKFPAVTRDIAVIVDDGIPVRNIEKVIIGKAGKIFEEAKLFDVYRGKQVPEGKKSVAYSITFRAHDRTLTDEEVNKAMEKITNTLSDELGAQLRM